MDVKNSKKGFAAEVRNSSEHGTRQEQLSGFIVSALPGRHLSSIINAFCIN
jgi:hypothetical protein